MRALAGLVLSIGVGRLLRELLPFGVAHADRCFARLRAARRLMFLRSVSDRPPHTPSSCPDSSAHCRHCSMTGQRRLLWGPVLCGGTLYRGAMLIF